MYGADRRVPKVILDTIDWTPPKGSTFAHEGFGGAQLRDLASGYVARQMNVARFDATGPKCIPVIFTQGGQPARREPPCNRLRRATSADGRNPPSTLRALRLHNRSQETRIDTGER